VAKVNNGGRKGRRRKDRKTGPSVKRRGDLTQRESEGELSNHQLAKGKEGKAGNWTALL
jgi:hypothetical protein